MPGKISIYASEPIERVLAQASDFGGRSQRISQIAQRYDAIMTETLARLTFTAGEWLAICDANNGTAHDDAGVSWRHHWANLWDFDEDLDAKWGIDRKRLSQRLQALDAAGTAAVAEIIDRFWCRSGRQPTEGETYVQRLRGLGVCNIEEEAKAD